jgi:phosphate transport system substrate-binding protein
MWPLFVLGAVALISIIYACFLDNKAVKGILSAVSFFGFLLFAFLSAEFLLPSYIGADSNWFPFVVCGMVYVVFILFAWKPFKVRIRHITAFSIAGMSVLLAAVFLAPAIYRQSLPQAGDEEVNLWRYTPFGDYWYVDGVLTHHDSDVKVLDEESSLKLEGELPRLDGATALYPVYSAFVRATYPAPEPNLDIPEYFPYGSFFEESIVICSRTRTAFENLIEGNADIIFLMGVSEEQRAMAEERGLKLILTPIGSEAFVFFVNSRNSISNLSVDEIKQIYYGNITNWREVGGGNNEIRAYQRPNESGSQTMLKQILGGIPLIQAPMDDIYDTMSGMYQRVASYRNYRNSLGYSFLYYIRDMIGENKVKFLSVDEIAPTHENIASGKYPFANNFYAITVQYSGEYLNPERTENINKLLEWIQSPQGQYLVEATGYVRIG